MRKTRAGFPGVLTVGRVCAALAACTLSLMACGGDASIPAAPSLVMAEDAAVGETMSSDDWEVTLLDVPHKDGIIGDESEKGIELITEYQVAAREAQGVWVVTGVRLSNVGEDNMLLATTIQVVDDQGREFPLGDRLVHNSQVMIADPERWGNIRDSQLSQNVQLAGQTREGPLIFDVAEDATGLELVLKGSDATIDLGF